MERKRGRGALLETDNGNETADRVAASAAAAPQVARGSIRVTLHRDTDRSGSANNASMRSPSGNSSTHSITAVPSSSSTAGHKRRRVVQEALDAGTRRGERNCRDRIVRSVRPDERGGSNGDPPSKNWPGVYFNNREIGASSRPLPIHPGLVDYANRHTTAALWNLPEGRPLPMAPVLATRSGGTTDGASARFHQPLLSPIRLKCAGQRVVHVVPDTVSSPLSSPAQSRGHSRCSSPASKSPAQSVQDTVGQRRTPQHAHRDGLASTSSPPRSHPNRNNVTAISRKGVSVGATAADTTATTSAVAATTTPLVAHSMCSIPKTRTTQARRHDQRPSSIDAAITLASLRIPCRTLLPSSPGAARSEQLQ